MRTCVLFALLVVAAGARLLLQVVVTPPYAGLDEPYHVARIAFVRAEHRDPSLYEPSVPHYIGTALREGAPSFGRPLADRSATLHPFETKNYEAQQPSLYYRVAAPLTGGTAFEELRRLRFLSLFCGIAIVVAAAFCAWRLAGESGILAAALIASFPTWETLVARASNDALACAFAAAGLAITVAAPGRMTGLIAEALVWAAAIATKLIVWPLAVVIPLFWRAQKASRRRMVTVTLVCAAAAALTMADLHERAGNPLGDVGLNPPSFAATPRPIDIIGMLKVTVASGIWTSGQHADALTSPAMALYAFPLIVAIAIAAAAAIRRTSADAERMAVVVALAAAAAFALAQAVHATGFIRQARAAGIPLPLGGKEGWYWYALAPVLAAVLALVVRRWWWIAIWIVGWDVLITEGALFHDYAGTASPLQPSVLFRWGPLQPPFTADTAIAALGPMASYATAIRVVQIVAMVAMMVIVVRSPKPETRNQEEVRLDISDS